MLQVTRMDEFCLLLSQNSISPPYWIGTNIIEEDTYHLVEYIGYSLKGLEMHYQIQMNWVYGVDIIIERTV